MEASELQTMARKKVLGGVFIFVCGYLILFIITKFHRVIIPSFKAFLGSDYS
jgi:hypothetical protein